MDDVPAMPAPVETDGLQSLTDPFINKGTAYTADERARLRLDGLLPPRVESLPEQVARVMENVRGKASPLDQYRYLSAVQSDNATLFYRVLLDHLEEMLPVVYTPTVGQACLEWSRIYERPKGLYCSAAQHRGRLEQLLRHWPRREVRIVVVTDGGRILGLGDLGANGMGIPVGKLSLYTACAGVPPERCLPVTLDVGTDNAPLLEAPGYLGERHARLVGDAYDTFIEEFVAAVQAVFPGAVLQFEDFNNASAFRLLHRYRDRLCCFNDDVQGTGAMGLAGLYSAGRVTGRGLTGQRVLFVGAGEACLGIGATVVAAMKREGLSEAEARERCLFFDSKGLVVTSRPDLPEHKRPFALDRPHTADLLAAVEAFSPTVLLGACGQPGIFTEAVLGAMARLNERPIVLALSNPTSKAECTADQAYAWTGGRAVFASGSPFGPVSRQGRTHVTGQANNSFIFPGVGFGLVFSGARLVTDEMFFAAAGALAGEVSNSDLQQGRIFPPAGRMRAVALAVAAAVADVAYGQGHAATPPPADLRSEVARAMYVPDYS